MTNVLDGNILDGKTAAAEIRSETAAKARAMVAILRSSGSTIRAPSRSQWTFKRIVRCTG